MDTGNAIPNNGVAIVTNVKPSRAENDSTWFCWNESEETYCNSSNLLILIIMNAYIYVETARYQQFLSSTDFFKSIWSLQTNQRISHICTHLNINSCISSGPASDNVIVQKKSGYSALTRLVRHVFFWTRQIILGTSPTLHELLICGVCSRVRKNSSYSERIRCVVYMNER